MWALPFFLSQLVFLLNCISQLYVLVFVWNFELVVTFFSAGEISLQPALSDIPGNDLRISLQLYCDPWKVLHL